MHGKHTVLGMPQCRLMSKVDRAVDLQGGDAHLSYLQVDEGIGKSIQVGQHLGGLVHQHPLGRLKLSQPATTMHTPISASCAVVRCRLGLWWTNSVHHLCYEFGGVPITAEHQNSIS